MNKYLVLITESSEKQDCISRYYLLIESPVPPDERFLKDNQVIPAQADCINRGFLECGDCVGFHTHLSAVLNYSPQLADKLGIELYSVPYEEGLVNLLGKGLVD